MSAAMMHARAYYNEIDPYAAQWLRNLITAGHIAAGDVDERSIVDVRAEDLKGYTQAHFFAGIGGWCYALQLARWDDARPVWTGSCPCQPFSAAGQGKAADDSRHLWPAWFPLIAECRPPTVFGEQVEAALGWGWLDAVFADLEGEGYACGTAVLPACGVGAPHIRQRVWFVADSAGGREKRPAGTARHRLLDVDWNGEARFLADAMFATVERRTGSFLRTQAPLGGARISNGRVADGLADGGEAGELGDTSRQFVNGRWNARSERWREPSDASFWRDCEWLPCTDGKARPVEPGTFPLAYGIPKRVGRLRAYGNAIVPQVAAEFIGAFMECRP